MNRYEVTYNDEYSIIIVAKDKQEAEKAFHRTHANRKINSIKFLERVEGT